MDKDFRRMISTYLLDLAESTVQERESVLRKHRETQGVRDCRGQYFLGKVRMAEFEQACYITWGVTEQRVPLSEIAGVVLPNNTRL